MSEGRATDAAAAKGGVRFATFLLVVYVWWFVATPYNSGFLSPVLSALSFEKALVALCAVTILFGGALTWRSSPLHPPMLLLLAWLFAGYFSSPYAGVETARHWADNYWKLFVFHLLIVLGVRDRKQLGYLLVGAALVSLLYQLHSWKDFLMGGSYVWQQGLKRMVGVWSGGGIGAANQYGFLAVFTVPFVLAARSMAKGKGARRIWSAGLLVCALSAVFSGTRAAFVTLFFLLLLHYGTRLFRFKILAAGLATALVVAWALPDDLYQRLVDRLIPSDQASQSADDPWEEISRQSAESRLEGLKDGFALFLKRPLLGYGPGASPEARRVMVGAPENQDEGALQLHSLYGQVLSEGGLVGTLAFLWFVGAFFRVSRKCRAHLASSPAPGDGEALAVARALWMAMWLLLFYGLFTHNLYRFQWFLLSGMLTVLAAEVRRGATPSRLPWRRAGKVA